MDDLSSTLTTHITACPKPLIHQKAQSNIQLKLLALIGISFICKSSNSIHFLEEVKKLKSLNTLKLNFLKGFIYPNFVELLCILDLRRASL